ncbi:MAG: HAD-IC family P-type ATPase [Legionellales bacterium]|jgi:calcium-translocating P-type ATPase
MNNQWHADNIHEICNQLDTHLDGLTEQQAQNRLAIYGPNQLKPAKRKGFFLRLLAQFNHVLIYILLGSAAISALLFHWIDMTVILSVVVINAIVGLIQEGKAETALNAISHMLSLKAEVIRDKKRASILAKWLVPGDIVLLKSGDKVPADLRLIDVKNLQIQESILTGESLPVEKSIEPTNLNTPLNARSCMAYAGTLVTYGKATGVVVATGDQTEVGHIGVMLEKIPELTTPLLKKLNAFSKTLTLIILAFACLCFILGIFIRHYSVQEMLMVTISLAVAAIPEGLPAIITITLTLGVIRMAHRSAIIRKLPAIETLGAVNVICTDKTGTLTLNKLVVENITTTLHSFSVTGIGYSDDGDFLLNNIIINPDDYIDLTTAIRGGILCNDAQLFKDNNQWVLQGNPMDGALLALGLKSEINLSLQKKIYPLTDLIPFESEYKLMATLHHDHLGNGYIYVKGAPEKIISMCSKQLADNKNVPIDKQFWLDKLQKLAATGQRILAIAIRPTNLQHQFLQLNDIESDLTMVALFGLLDPPRPETIQAISECQAAGIEVKLITGDHVATAQAIATQLGINDSHRVLDGDDLDKLRPSALLNQINQTNVFARTTSLHKLKIVEALQSKQKIVAMTGDGVNDALALKRANVGISMGIKGTEVAKEASDIVLANDDFSSIVSAIKEGRTVYENIRKTILFVLPTDGGEALLILIAILFGWALPITPLQILWINTVTAITLGLALAFEKPEKEVMNRPPRKLQTPIFSPLLIWRMGFMSLLLMLSGFGFFIWARELNLSMEVARTLTVNALVMGEIAYLFNTRKILGSALSLEGLFGNKAILIATAAVIIFQILFCYSPWLQDIFNTAALSFVHWIYIFLFGLVLFLLVECEKYLINRLFKKVI